MFWGRKRDLYGSSFVGGGRREVGDSTVGGQVEGPISLLSTAHFVLLITMVLAVPGFVSRVRFDWRSSY